MAGILLGAGGVALAALAPGFYSEQFAKLPALMPGQDDLDVVFEFPELLRDSEVPIDPALYGDPQAPAPSAGADAAPPMAASPDEDAPLAAPVPARAARIFIQAASFRNADDADQLRAQLLLQSLPVKMEQVVLDSGTWHRITVGPLESPSEANNIMARLRQQNLSAIRVNPG